MNFEQASHSASTGTAPTTAQVIKLGELHGELAHRPQELAVPVLDNLNPLHSVRARLQVCVGEVELTIGELLAAREHQVLVLNRTVEQPVDMLLENKVVARGHLVAVEGCFAVRITELPVILKA